MQVINHVSALKHVGIIKNIIISKYISLELHDIPDFCS